MSQAFTMVRDYARSTRRRLSELAVAVSSGTEDLTGQGATAPEG